MSAEGLKLTIYFGERDRVGGRLLSDVLMARFGDAEVLASILIRGVEGFGIKHQLRTDRLLTLSDDLPLMAVAVDRARSIERLVDAVLSDVGAGLVTLERVTLPGLQLDDVPSAFFNDTATPEIYTGRGEERGGRELVGAFLARLRDAGLPGATAIAGLDGTIIGERRRARFFSRNDLVPAIVVSVGPRERIFRLLPALRGIAGRHVTTLERVHVVRRAGRVLADLPAPPARDERGLARWQRVMVFCGEDARWEGHHPLHSQLIRRLREANAAGATVLRGSVGFSDDHGIHGDRVFSIRRRTPVVVTMIDTVPEIARLWPIVARATARTGLVTAELVPAYRAHAGEGRAIGGLALADGDY
mgnify:FL=1